MAEGADSGDDSAVLVGVRDLVDAGEVSTPQVTTGDPGLSEGGEVTTPRVTAHGANSLLPDLPT